MTVCLSQMKIPCIRYEGWEVKHITLNEYKPDPDWYPFAITVASTTNAAQIWLRKLKVTFTEVDEDDNKED